MAALCDLWKIDRYSGADQKEGQIDELSHTCRNTCRYVANVILHFVVTAHHNCGNDGSELDAKTIQMMHDQGIRKCPKCGAK